MVNPAYFFSTLAQVSATIIGFVVAFGVGLYPLAEERREKKRSQLRSVLTDFTSDYLPAVRAMSFIAHSGGVTTKNYLMDSTKTEEELREKIENDPEQSGEDAPIVWAHLFRINTLLENVNPKNNFLLTPQELDTLRNSIYWLYTYFDRVNDSNKQFYLEISDKVNSDDVPEHYFLDNVYNSGEGEPNPEQSLERWLKVEADGRHRNWAGMGTDDSGLSGRNLFSFAAVLEYMKQDYDGKIDPRRSGGSGYEPRIKKILHGAFAASITGVLLPMLFLFAPPTLLSPFRVDGLVIYGIEWVYLILSTATVGYLMYQMWKQYAQITTLPGK